ncbi:hypothetical protein V8F20_000273 [Naviculisporaceae sp. PSN 640]
MPPKKAAPASEENGAGADAGAGSGAQMIKGKIPSEGDQRFFLAMIANLVSKPDVNWEGVAKAMGLKDTKCTKERWRQITKKYELELQEAATPATPAAKRGRKPATTNTGGENENAEEGSEGDAAPATPAKRGRKPAAIKTDAENENADSGEGDVRPTPKTPKTKTPRGKKKRASPGGDNDEDDIEGTPAKKKQAARKPRGPNKKTVEAQVTTPKEEDNAPVDTDMKDPEVEVKEDPDSSLSPAPPSATEGDEN